MKTIEERRVEEVLDQVSTQRKFGMGGWTKEQIMNFIENTLMGVRDRFLPEK